MGKADQERISREPQTFEEGRIAVYVGRGRISMNDYYTHFGNSQEERIKNIWMYAKDGQRLDVLNESSIFGQYPHLLAGLDGAMDMENAFIDVIKSHTGKKQYKGRGFDYVQSRPTEEGVPEEELERQRNEQEYQ